MVRLVVIRVLAAVPTLLVASVVIFGAMRMVGGDPVRNQLGLEADPVVVERLREAYGLDQPVPVQYAKWLQHVVTGDWGASLFTRRPVLGEIGARISITLELVGASMLIAWLIAIPIGILAALRRGSFLDLGLMTAAVVGISTPEFLLGAVLILVFSLYLDWLPAVGFATFQSDPVANIRSLILPAISLGIARAALLTRIVRAEMIEVMGQEYIRTARAKGLRERGVIGRHALKNALIPVVTVGALQIGAALGGAVVVESVFGIPGMGTYGISALLKRDYPAIQAFVLVIAIGFVGANLLVDVTYALLDPRIRVDS